MTKAHKIKQRFQHYLILFDNYQLLDLDEEIKSLTLISLEEWKKKMRKIFIQRRVADRVRNTKGIAILKKEHCRNHI